MMKMILEVPCGNIESVQAAKQGGADRIELCSALRLGGLTPSPAMFDAVSNIGLEVVVMIRPREGDFNYSKMEFEMMLKEIDFFKNAGAAGIVSGILTTNLEIDMERTKELLEVSYPLPFTFHRAFDLAANPYESFNRLLELKVDRLLSSGQASDAFVGLKLISELVKLSQNKIQIIAGAGINPGNVAAICTSGVTAIHLSGKKKKNSEKPHKHSSVVMGVQINDDSTFDVTDADVIKQVRKIIDELT